MRRLFLPAYLSAAGGICRHDHHVQRACPRPQDWQGRYRRVSGGVEEVRLARLARRSVAVPYYELLFRARRLLHPVHRAEHGGAQLRPQQHSRRQRGRRNDIHGHASGSVRLRSVYGAVPRHLHGHRQGRHRKRHREVQQDRYAGAVRHARYRHRPLPVTPRRIRRTQVHVRTRLWR